MSKDIRCVHGKTIEKYCNECELEMMQDFITHNIEELTTEEAVQCIREGIMSLNELSDGLERRIKTG
jgi:hypothetical protein